MNHHRRVLQCGLLLAVLAGGAAGANRGTPTQAAGTPSSELPVVRGVVLDPNGRPEPNVAVSLLGLPPQQETITNARGTFELRPGALAKRYPACTVARSRTRNLAAAVRFDPDANGPLTIKLAPGEVLSGRVTDVKGKGIPAAEIALVLRSDSLGWGLEQAFRTDPNGRYEIRAVPAGYVYTVSAKAKGYGEIGIQVGTAGVREDRIDLQPFVLQIANLDMSGIVVDANDKPFRNVNVACRGPGQRFQLVSVDAQGRFTFQGLCAGSVEVRAVVRPPLSGVVQATAGATDVKVVVRPTTSGDPNAPAQAPSLVGKPLPSLAELGIGSAAASFKDRPILVCFFDAGQRPSRNTVTALAKRVDDLKLKGVAVIGVRMSEGDNDASTPWLGESSAALRISSVKGDAAKAKLVWGIQGLPWLILADASHNARAEGFAIDDLDEILQKIK